MGSFTYVDFFYWFAIIMAALTALAWSIKKSAYLGLILGVAIAYLLFQATGLSIHEVLGFFR